MSRTEPHSFLTIVRAHELGPHQSDSGDWQAGELNKIFRELSEIWCKRHSSARNEELAAHLDIRPQSCSQWKYGTAGRKPTMSAIATLCDDLNMQMVLDSDGLRVIRRRKRL